MRNLALAILLSVNLFGWGQVASRPERLFLEQGTSGNVFVGVSDPGADSPTGCWQAVSRAIMLYAFSQNVSVNIVNDSYSRENLENGNPRIEEIMKSLSVLDTDCRNVSYEIDTMTETRQGEKVVALRVFDDPMGVMFTSKSMNFFNLVSFDADDSIDGKNEMLVQLDTCTMNYRLHRFNKEWNSRSSFCGTDVAVDRSRKIYADMDCPTDGMCGDYSLENGLWQAFVMSLEEIPSKAQNLECKLKALQENVADAVGGEAKPTTVQDLTRTVCNLRLKAIPETMCIKDNRLYVNWHVQPLE